MDRFVVWKYSGPSLSAGWGNQQRGFSGAMLLAIATNRTFLMDYPRYFRVFQDSLESPIDARHQKYQKAMQLPRFMVPLGGGNPQNPALVERMRTDEVFHYHLEQPVLQIGCGCTMGTVLWENPLLKDLFFRRLGTRSHAEAVSVLLRSIQTRFTPAFARDMDRYKAGLGWGAAGSVMALQFRAWTDVPSRRVDAASSSTILCLKRHVHAWMKAQLGGPRLTRLTLWVTSDSAAAMKGIRSALQLGTAVRVITTADAKLPGELESREARALVDWYLLGEPDAAVCSGTTYCLSARARGGGIITKDRFAAKCPDEYITSGEVDQIWPPTANQSALARAGSGNDWEAPFVPWRV